MSLQFKLASIIMACTVPVLKEMSMCIVRCDSGTNVTPMLRSAYLYDILHAS